MPEFTGIIVIGAVFYLTVTDGIETNGSLVSMRAANGVSTIRSHPFTRPMEKAGWVGKKR